MLGKGSGARFGGAAAEIFAVVGHARLPSVFVLSGNTPRNEANLLRGRDDCESPRRDCCSIRRNGTGIGPLFPLGLMLLA